jgi:hypothetical protein
LATAFNVATTSHLFAFLVDGGGTLTASIGIFTASGKIS